MAEPYTGPSERAISSTIMDDARERKREQEEYDREKGRSREEEDDDEATEKTEMVRMMKKTAMKKKRTMTGPKIMNRRIDH
jgi:hypothetical protein